jgi:hypothetical protein
VPNAPDTPRATDPTVLVFGGETLPALTTKNYQLRRMQYKDPSGGGSVDLTITYENVKVTPPANYTDFKAGP